MNTDTPDFYKKISLFCVVPALKTLTKPCQLLKMYMSAQPTGGEKIYDIY